MEKFRNLRKKHSKNTLMGYLNINSIRNKNIDLKQIVKYLEPYNFAISKIKFIKPHDKNLFLIILRFDL